MVQTAEGLAEAFPIGVFIKEELEARDWSQADLAEIMSRPPTLINELITGKRALSAELAKELGEALGTGAEYWMNLDMIYRLWRSKEPDNSIARRSNLYQKAPIKEMVKRNWIEPSESIEILEHRIMRFLGQKTESDPIALPHAARKGMEELTPSHWAWIHRVRQLAVAAPCNKTFSASSFDAGMKELKRLIASAPEVIEVPRILADTGIRFMIVEHLPHTKIDGITLWHNGKYPIIALSMRYDRIDYFWHTLIHELGHVSRRDGTTQVILDTEMFGEDSIFYDEEAEKAANEFATDFLIGKTNLNNFISRVSPLYGRTQIVGFARRIKVHPGIVVGQLQYRKEIGWSSFRPMLDKVRHIVIRSALTDGWGQLAPQIR